MKRVCVAAGALVVVGTGGLVAPASAASPYDTNRHFTNRSHCLRVARQVSRQGAEISTNCVNSAPGRSNYLLSYSYPV